MGSDGSCGGSVDDAAVVVSLTAVTVLCSNVDVTVAFTCCCETSHGDCCVTVTVGVTVSGREVTTVGISGRTTFSVALGATGVG